MPYVDWGFGVGQPKIPNYSPKTNVPKPKKFPANLPKAPPKPKWKPFSPKVDKPIVRPKKTPSVAKPQQPSRFVITRDVKGPKVTSVPDKPSKSNALRVSRSLVIQRVIGRAMGALGAITFWEGQKPDQTIPDDVWEQQMLQFSNPSFRNEIESPKAVSILPGETVPLTSNAVDMMLRSAEVTRLPDLYASEVPIKVDTSRLQINLQPSVAGLKGSKYPGSPAVQLSPETTIHVGNPHKIITDFIIENMPELDVETVPDLENLEIEFEQTLDNKGDIIVRPRIINVPQTKLEPAAPVRDTWEEVRLELPRSGRPRVRVRRVSTRRAKADKRQRKDQKSRYGRLYLKIKKFVDKTIGGDEVELYFILTDNLISDPQTRRRPPYRKGYITFYDREVGKWRYKAKTPAGALEGFNSGFLHLDSEGLARDMIENAIEDRVIGEFSRRANKSFQEMNREYGGVGREVGLQFGPTL